MTYPDSGLFPVWRKDWKTVARLTHGPLTVAEISLFNGSWYASALQVIESNIQSPDKTVMLGRTIAGPFGMRDSAEAACEGWYRERMAI